MKREHRNEHFSRHQQHTRNITADAISICGLIVLIYLALT